MRRLAPVNRDMPLEACEGEETEGSSLRPRRRGLRLPDAGAARLATRKAVSTVPR